MRRGRWCVGHSHGNWVEGIPRIALIYCFGGEQHTRVIFGSELSSLPGVSRGKIEWTSPEIPAHIETIDLLYLLWTVLTDVQ